MISACTTYLLYSLLVGYFIFSIICIISSLYHIKLCYFNIITKNLYLIRYRELTVDQVRPILNTDPLIQKDYPIRYNIDNDSKKEIIVNGSRKNHSLWIDYFLIVTIILLNATLSVTLIYVVSEYFGHIMAGISNNKFDFTFAAVIILVTAATQLLLKTHYENKSDWVKTLNEYFHSYFTNLTFIHNHGDYVESMQKGTYSCNKDMDHFDKYSINVDYKSIFSLTSKIELHLDHSKYEHRSLIALVHLRLGIIDLPSDISILHDLGFTDKKKEMIKSELNKQFNQEHIELKELTSKIFRLTQFIMQRERLYARII